MCARSKGRRGQYREFWRSTLCTLWAWLSLMDSLHPPTLFNFQKFLSFLRHLQAEWVPLLHFRGSVLASLYFWGSVLAFTQGLCFCASAVACSSSYHHFFKNPGFRRYYPYWVNESVGCSDQEVTFISSNCCFKFSCFYNFWVGTLPFILMLENFGDK